MAREAGPLGNLIKYWRNRRRMSQLDLAVSADVSSRHLSFLETGRAQPSRDMVLRLAEVLDVPLRERNALLHAAGYAHGYRETPLDDPDMAPIRRSLEFLLAHHEPYPAVVVDRRWNVQMQNPAAARLLVALIEPGALAPPVNVMRLMFDPAGLRPYIVNWPEVAAALVQRLHREALAGGPDDRAAEDMLALALASGVPSEWRVADLSAPPPVTVALHVRKGDLELRLFSAITTLGTPIDITAQEIRLETFFPADPATEATLRSLA